MNFWEILILFFSFQALILAILFAFRKTGDKIANRLLAFFLFLFSYNLLYNVLYWSRFDMKLFVAISYTYTIPISLYGPLFLFYARRVTKAKGLSLKDLIHLGPLCFVFFQFGAFYILPLQSKIDVLTSGQHGEYIRFVSWGYPFLVAILFGYGLFTYLKFVRHYKSDPELSIWIKTISGTFLLYTFAHVIYCTSITLSWSLPQFEYDYFITLFMILLIGSVCYFAFVHASVFNGTPIKKVLPFVKYEKTGLSSEFSLEMKERLIELMNTEKPFLNPDIRLDTLAQMLDVSRHHASQIINEHFSVNFFDFINQYRIREAEQLLTSAKSENSSITDIAYQSGFNNRISFYKAFKKILGTTPSEYRNHNLVS